MKVSRLIAAMAALVMLLSVIQPPAQAATSQGSVTDREQWSDWEIIRQPTCTEPGLRTRSSNMGTSERESIPAAGHQYGPWALTQEATCQQQARETHTCRVCGHSEWRVSGGLGPHQWGEWTLVREPAPGAPGLRQRQCAVCGVTETEEVPYSDDLPAVAGPEEAPPTIEPDVEPDVEPETEPEDEPSPLGLSLVAVNLDADQEPYDVDDVVRIKATALNTGSVQLDEIIIYDPYGFPAGYCVNKTLPGETYSKTFEYTVTQEDVENGSICFDIEAVGWSVGAHDAEEVWAAPVTFDLATVFGTESMPLLQLGWSVAPFGVLTAGTPITLSMLLMNTGDQPVTVSGLYTEPAARSYQDVASDFFAVAAGALIPVDGTLGFVYHMVVTPEDVDAGAVERDLSVGYTWTRDTDGAEFSFVTNHARFKITIDDGAPHPALTLSGGAVSAEGQAVGSRVSVPMTLTNTGNVPIEFHGICIAAYTDDDHDLADDAWDAWNEHLNEVLYPGDGFTVGHWTNVVPFDLFMGYVSRSVQAYGIVTADENGDFTVPDDMEQDVESNWEPFYLELGTPEDQALPVSIVKSRIGGPANGSGYQEMEPIHYQVTVSNDSEDPLTGLKLFDPIFRELEIPLVGERDTLAPGETWTVDFYYTVTAEDVAEFSTLYNIASVIYDPHPWDPEGGPAYSNAVEAPLWDGGEPSSLVLYKSYVFDPANGMYYTPGETVHFEVEVDNQGKLPVGDLIVTDPMFWSPENGTILGRYEAAEPGFHTALGFDYTVTEADLGGPMVITNTATGTGYIGNSYVIIDSNTVQVPVGRPDGRENFGISLVKEETSAPTHDGKYWIDETISYKITVTNTGMYPLFSLTVYDSLKTEDGGILGVIPELGPGESQSFSYEHVVTPSDVDAKEVWNYATVDYSIDPPMLDTLTSLPVVSYIGEQLPPPPRETPTDGDLCVRALNARGDDRLAYDLSLCAEHRALLDETNALIAAAAAEGKAAAYGTADARWREAVDALYSALLAARPQSGEAILASRAAWRQLLSAYEDSLLKTAGLTAADAGKKLYETLIPKAVDLCWAAHKAGANELSEGLLSGQYHPLGGSAGSATEARLGALPNGRLRLSVTLGPGLALIEKILSADLKPGNAPETQAAVLAAGALAYRNVIAGQGLRADAPEEGIAAFRSLQVAACALLERDQALWSALWPESPVIAAELSCREARELAVLCVGSAAK